MFSSFIQRVAPAVLGVLLATTSERLQSAEIATEYPANTVVRPNFLTTTQLVRAYPKVGRNEVCPCGSGKKFKKCHG